MQASGKRGVLGGWRVNFFVLVVVGQPESSFMQLRHIAVRTSYSFHGKVTISARLVFM